LTVNAQAQLLALSTAVLEGEFKFRLATNALEVLLDADLRLGFPANDAFDLYLTAELFGTLVADYRGVHGLLNLTPIDAASKPELEINLSTEKTLRVVLNTTGQDLVVNEVTLSAERIFGIEAVADLHFILGDYDGQVFIGLTNDSLLFDLDGDITIFSGHKLALDTIL
jgi:hypothetical protein